MFQTNACTSLTLHVVECGHHHANLKKKRKTSFNLKHQHTTLMLLQFRFQIISRKKILEFNNFKGKLQ